MDVSNDLTELGRTPVAVVCSGVKSILDIPKTLEYLETQGVTVATLKSKHFPAFYTRDSGITSPITVESELEAARLVKANMDLQLSSGIVIAVPIPEQYSPDADKLQQIIDEAIQTATSQGIRGRDVTPFILNRVAVNSGGLSLRANVALVQENARVGTQIAIHLMELCKHDKHDNARSSILNTVSKASPSHRKPPIMIIGGTALDFTGRIETLGSTSKIMYTSNPGTLTQTLGGVGRNIAEACFRSGGNPVLVSVIGKDMIGRVCLDAMNALGMVCLVLLGVSLVRTLLIPLNQS